MNGLDLILRTFPGSEVLTAEETAGLELQLDSWPEYLAWIAHNAKCPPLRLADIPTTNRQVRLRHNREAT